MKKSYYHLNINQTILPAVDEDLGVVLDTVGEDPEGPGLKLLLLLGVPLLGGHLVLVAHDDAFMPTNLLRMKLFCENVFVSTLLISRAKIHSTFTRFCR